MATSITTKHTVVSTTFDSDGDNTAQAGYAGKCRLVAVEVSNSNTSDAYLQLFDAATGDVTVGTTTPKLSLFVPAASATSNGAMDNIYGMLAPDFNTALTYACTTTATGNGDPTTGLTVNLVYAIE